MSETQPIASLCADHRGMGFRQAPPRGSGRDGLEPPSEDLLCQFVLCAAARGAGGEAQADRRFVSTLDSIYFAAP
jgi:hypothetical protein